ncbi:Rabenosyn-5-like Protein [Tribolium castaneum]|uniref:Rabenosyn-5-like Protein n=1 Tax=Tribolium castaneum TaxID=7070 RepID=D6WRG2_TRICA|nr:PREDICTED: rabenosyn-5 [Tribolium castaneum]EFA06457.1 Rabenosyn-5-like Protein [Tribolium castaneum]|eukprot:XP_973735.1 PREDICTED: rabenosyn-5 [Tribolium castaneum]
MAEANLIKEGFLCPICHKDLRSPNNLIAHFQDLHSEEQDILKSIKDLYGKAKKKILKLDEQDLEVFKNEITLEKYYLEISEPQEPGQIRSHTDYFKAVRRERLDHRTTETNKFIIRLDRLLRFYGSDRKQQEQELVAWLDGSTVTRCPSCASSFNITRRQHHCRLCGSIMCNACSYFLPYETAQAIVAPVHNVDVNNREQVQGKEPDSLRICNHCLDMLESRRRVQLEQMRQPIICQLYNHLQNLKSQTQSSVDLYLKMYNSLTSGETTFQLQDTQSLRASIAKKAESIDILSKKIASLPVDEETPKVELLQNSIRRGTSHYIKDYLLTLPAPPSVQELERIKRERSLRNTEEENQLAVKTNIKRVTVTTGWSPAAVSNENTETEDPLIEQMNIVRNYIDQARKAQRFEEVASLQENLKMLKETYKQQQLTRDS